MAVIRFIINLFRKSEEDTEPPEQPPGRLPTYMKKMKIPMWVL